MPTLHLLVGLPGSGKTTRARELEDAERAVRLTPDEWMQPLFGAGDSDGKRAVLEHELLWGVAARVLSLGVNVVLDYGLWSRRERELYRVRAQAVGALARLHVLDVPLDELWLRLQARNAALPARTFVVTRDELDHWHGWFERPDATELAAYASG